MPSTTRDKLYRTEAIVLRHWRVGEADRVLVLYSPNLGKFRAIAKGVARPTSHLGGHLELLVRSRLQLAKSKGDLDIVTQSETVDPHMGFRDDLRLIAHASVIGDLLDSFTVDHVENYPLYRLVNDTLNWLGQANDPDLLTLWYTMQLLGFVGYRPELNQCLSCNAALQPNEGNGFSGTLGGMVCPACAASQRSAVKLSLSAFKVARLLQRSNDYAEVDRVRVPEEVRGEIKRAMDAYVQYILDRELRSSRFLASTLPSAD